LINTKTTLPDLDERPGLVETPQVVVQTDLVSVTLNRLDRIVWRFAEIEVAWILFMDH